MYTCRLCIRIFIVDTSQHTKVVRWYMQSYVFKKCYNFVISIHCSCNFMSFYVCMCMLWMQVHMYVHPICSVAIIRINFYNHNALKSFSQQLSVVSIHWPLGYRPSMLPLHHSAITHFLCHLNVACVVHQLSYVGQCAYTTHEGGHMYECAT